MKIALVNSSCNHTLGRLWPFLSHLGAHYYHNCEDFEGGDYDIILFESNCKTDISSKVGSARLVCFDSEDDPSERKLGPSFYALEDRAEAFAKIVIQSDRPVTKLREIKLPIVNYLWYHQVSSIDRSLKQRDEPYFIGAPTLITDFDRKYPQSPLLDQKISAVSRVDGNSLAYHQRFHWLSELKKVRNITGGLTWGGGNLSEEWQSKYFEGILEFGHPRISQVDQIKSCLSHKLCLSPGGMCRWSFRMFDLMATGAPFLSADLDKKEMLFMPEYYITVRDGDDIVKMCDQDLNKNDFTVNRKILQGQTPEKIWQKFLKQLDDLKRANQTPL